MKTLIPTQLFIGQEEIINKQTELFLQQTYCTNKSLPENFNNYNFNNCTCNSCKKIKNHQHESIIWLEPEKDYTVEDLDIIFEKIKFSLDNNQKFFFIIKKANRLTSACANKLLKVLEEPPMGYHFILQTNNLNAIIPTILSRAHQVNFIDQKKDFIQENLNPIINFFLFYDLDNPVKFEKELKNQNLSDSQSIELLDELISFLGKKIINTNKTQDSLNLENIKYIQEIYNFLKIKSLTPPQSGSSNIFWKNLYISFPKK